MVSVFTGDCGDVSPERPAAVTLRERCSSFLTGRQASEVNCGANAVLGNRMNPCQSHTGGQTQARGEKKEGMEIHREAAWAQAQVTWLSPCSFKEPEYP